MSRIDEARKVVLELLDLLESSSSSTELCLMKAKRLARLMRDSDAQIWLDLETRGYPDKYNFSQLGTCQKYAVAGGRITTKGEYYGRSLPGFEAIWRADEAHIASMRASSPVTIKAKDFTEKRATEALMSSQIALQSAYKKNYVESQSQLISLKAAIHNYATDTYIAIELGDISEDIFRQSRENIDSFVRAHCPRAAEQIVSIDERLRDNNTESLSVALTSCRRLLVTVADSIFPAQSNPWIDQKGKTRKVGKDEYKNRLLAFIETHLTGSSVASLLSTEIEHLAAKLDAVVTMASKGVHSVVSVEEARITVIETYIFLGYIALFSKNTLKKNDKKTPG